MKVENVWVLFYNEHTLEHWLYTHEKTSGHLTKVTDVTGTLWNGRENELSEVEEEAIFTMFDKRKRTIKIKNKGTFHVLGKGDLQTE